MNLAVAVHKQGVVAAPAQTGLSLPLKEAVQTLLGWGGDLLRLLHRPRQASVLLISDDASFARQIGPLLRDSARLTVLAGRSAAGRLWIGYHDLILVDADQDYAGPRSNADSSGFARMVVLARKSAGRHGSVLIIGIAPSWMTVRAGLRHKASDYAPKTGGSEPLRSTLLLWLERGYTRRRKNRPR